MSTSDEEPNTAPENSTDDAGPSDEGVDAIRSRVEEDVDSIKEAADRATEAASDVVDDAAEVVQETAARSAESAAAASAAMGAAANQARDVVDLGRTVELVKGALFDWRATWAEYRDENQPWFGTLMLLTLPLVVGSALGAFVFGIFGDSPNFGARGVGGLILGVVFGLISITVAGFLVSFVAEMFDGTPDFDRGFAAVSLALVPAYVGNILTPIPWLGTIVGIVTGIFSLVLLYGIIPSYLDVPQEKRIPHFAISLLGILIVNGLIGMLIL